MIKGQGIFPSLRANIPMKYDNCMRYYLEKRFKLAKDVQETQWDEFFKQMTDNQLIQMEIFLIKNFIKENFKKMNIQPINSMVKSLSKRIYSKGSMI